MCEYSKRVRRPVHSLFLCIEPSYSRHGIGRLKVWLEETPFLEKSGIENAQTTYKISLQSWDFVLDSRDTLEEIGFQRLVLTEALANGEVHGKFAVDTAHQLLHAYAITVPEFRRSMREYLPNLVDSWEKAYGLGD